MAAQTPTCDFDWTAVDFHLRGTDGKTYSLAEVRGPKGTLVMFICNHCPYVKAVIGRLVEDVAALRTHGIGAVAIMPNDVENYPEDSFENMQRFAANNGFTFPYLIDDTQAIARAYGAICTPDFYGFNAADRLQYRGRFDSAGMSGAPAPKRELFEAMTAIAATGKGPETQHPSIGCTIKWKAGT